MKDLLIAVKGWDPEHWSGCLRAALPDRNVYVTDRFGHCSVSKDDLSEVHYVLAWKPDTDLLGQLPNLDVIFSLGAGVDHILDQPAIPDVPVVRIVDPDLTFRMGEYVVWQVLHHHRKGTAHNELQRLKQWGKLRHPAAHEVTVGIMGMGVLGQHAADLLVRLGFAVRGWSRTKKTVADVQMYYGTGGLPQFLAGTDILVALLPLTPETSEILDEGLINQLRQDGPLGGPVLINAGRGGSQVNADILRALQDGRLAGASLDVFPTEPLPENDALWDAPNLVITPHVAAVSSPEALSKGLARQITSYEASGQLDNLVDRNRGY